MTPSSMDLSNMEQLQNSKIQLHVQPSERTYDELTNAEKIHEGCDIKATKIVLQGLPQDIYNMVTHHSKAKDIWDRVKLLIQGSELHCRNIIYVVCMIGVSLCIHYFSVRGGRHLLYYIQFAQFINDMHTIGMTMQPCQVNTKFINHLQREWSKFVTDVKLAKDMHNTNFDHLYAYLRQHEAHANEVRLMRQRFLDPLAIVANTYNSSPSYTNQTQYHQQLSPIAQQYYSPPAPQQHSNDVPIVHQLSYQAPVVNHSLVVVSSFLPYNDPIASLNKAIAFISITFASRYPLTNNQLRTSSNPRNQTTIQEGRVTVQTVQGRQTQGYAGSGARSNATCTRMNRNGGTNIACQTKVVWCYKCHEEGHMARQYNDDIVTTVQAYQEIPTPGIFQTNDLDAFDSDCNEAPSASAILIAKLSAYDSDQYLNETENAVVQDTNSSAQQDAMLMSVIDEMSIQVAKWVIVDRNAKFADFEKQIQTLKLQLSATVESHKTLSTTVDVLKQESKVKEDKYLDDIIDLEKKKKALC
ncbi:hypothetical protein Tco_0464434 [Tanacetum coccineum]